MSTMFPLAPKGTVDKKTQSPWDPSRPYAGLGWRSVRRSTGSVFTPAERPLVSA